MNKIPNEGYAFAPKVKLLDLEDMLREDKIVVGCDDNDGENVG